MLNIFRFLEFLLMIVLARRRALYYSTEFSQNSVKMVGVSNAQHGEITAVTHCTVVCMRADLVRELSNEKPRLQ